MAPVARASSRRELPRAFLEEQRHQLEEQARQAQERFHEQTRRRGIRGEWRVTDGDIVGTARLHARYADLTVVGQGLDLEGARATWPSCPRSWLLGVGRPVLVVPRYGTFPTVGERVLIAWNGSREATRAVHDALPILQRAHEGHRPLDRPRRRSRATGSRARTSRSTWPATASRSRQRRPTALDIAVGDVLLSRGPDLGADLIVMGAYGHSRVREMVLGGATRHLLQHMTVPVLMSH